MVKLRLIKDHVLLIFERRWDGNRSLIKNWNCLVSTSTIWLVSAGSIFTHVVSFCIFPPSLITPRFRTVKGLFAVAHRPQQPPVCTAHRVAGPSRITHQDDLSSGWRHHVAPCAPISSLSYPRRSLVPCIAKQWKNTLSFLRCRRLKLERRGSRSKGYKWPLNPRSNTVHSTISIHILQHPGRQAQLTWSSQSPWHNHS